MWQLITPLIWVATTYERIVALVNPGQCQHFRSSLQLEGCLCIYSLIKVVILERVDDKWGTICFKKFTEPSPLLNFLVVCGVQLGFLSSSRFLGAGLMTFAPSCKPRYSIFLQKKRHLGRFIVNPALSRTSKTVRRCNECCSAVLE